MSRTRPIFAVALSVESAAKAIGCPRREIHDAIFKYATLRSFKGSNNRTRILVRELEKWIEEAWPGAFLKRHIELWRFP